MENSVNILKQTELLAPAKDLMTAIAAINSGADAIYIGANSFGARQAAGNNISDIKLLVEYAHKFYVKVHVTINTILTNEELEEAADLIWKLYDIGVDAVIVQDMGLINLSLQKKLPPIILHASTQCDNRNIEKIKFFEKIGISRVILARELSLEQINTICSNTNVEIETFIHGSLCVSYSGQCYLSYYIGGRSANRGECAQPCRKKYSLIDDKNNIIAKDMHLLSLKDFNASKFLKELVNIGVKSFKIEGRLKDINYVKNVVYNYRKELDKISLKVSSGKIFTEFEPDVNKSFNRGFTSYFLDKREKCYNFDYPNMRGEKIGKILKSGIGWFELNKEYTLHSQDGLCFFKDGKLSGCLVNNIKNKRIFINKKINIPEQTIIYRNFDFNFDKFISESKMVRKIGVSFEYSDNCLIAEDEDKNMFKIDVEYTDMPRNIDKMKEIFITQLQKTGESDFYVEKINIKDNVPFIPVSKINELRRNILDKLMETRIKNYKKETQKPLRYSEFIKETADYHENIHNKEAENFYKNCGCNIKGYSVESRKTKFEDIELMRTKHCLKYAFNMCKSPKKLFLIDEKGKKYNLKFDCKNCEMIICLRNTQDK